MLSDVILRIIKIGFVFLKTSNKLQNIIECFAYLCKVNSGYRESFNNIVFLFELSFTANKQSVNRLYTTL